MSLIDDQLTLATEVVRCIAAVGTDYSPPLVCIVLNLELNRFLEMYIQCVGSSIGISFFSKVAASWIKKGSTVQVRLPSASSIVSDTTQQTRLRGTILKEDAGVRSSKGRDGACHH